MSQVVPIQLDETEQAGIVFKEAFQNDRMMLWMFNDDLDLYNQYGAEIIATWVKFCVRYGLALRTKGFESCMVCRKPGDLSFTFWRMFRAGMFKTPRILGKQAMQRMDDLGKICAQAKKDLDAPLFWHCWMIGTQPEEQGKGYGNQLMHALFDIAAEDQLPVYLETVTGGASEKIHAHNGFKQVGVFDIPDADYQMTTMLRSVRDDAF